MSAIENALKFIRDHAIEFVDFRFTDLRGKWQHTCYAADHVDGDLLTDGVMFDGSSLAGWKDISQSDMILRPDPATIHIDPFAAQPSAVMFCDVFEPETGSAYHRDPRSLAKRAESYLVYTGLADEAFFGPELEFFLFDDVRYNVQMNGSMVSIDAEEGPYNSAKEYPMGNRGHRPKIKGGYFPVSPVDSMSDIRSEMLTVLRQVGIEPMLHHHEVAPAQNELGIKFSTLTKTADNVQKYKYVVHNVANTYGKTATFMPKPIKGDNGSGMHTHQSLWKNGKPLFAGSGYAELSEVCMYYIGGVIRHARAINAFTNASTNSYKRLVPGFEAPVNLAYSQRNRSASIRIPYVTSLNAKRIEARFPDGTANPYFAFAAMLMAGLDGIENKIHPGEAIEKDLYSLPREELEKLPTVARSFREALETLDRDREFLKKGDVFSDDLIDAYIDLRMQEVQEQEQTPHPLEFVNYFSV